MGILKGQVAVISGAGTGLGRAAAIAFAQEGANVVLLGRRQHKLDETASLISQAGPGTARTLVVPTDVSDEEQVIHAVEAALHEFGRLDIVINNAAVFEPGEVIELTRSEWERQIAVNLTGPFLLTKAALPSMRKAHFGRIINITSGLAPNGAGGYAAYSAAKAGLESLTRTVADEENEHGILVNLFNPGTLKTEMHATGKEPEVVTPDLLRLATLPPGGPSGTLVTY
ncbi:SDR family oxidoreductase [Paenibacillus oenotherae]|uniref:SDR family oxidoreductase n=1 Tax=Paenibacillus oenotherae TaxID=1435645 RepID=A0ABS7D3H4_9BACL|nr:SDR family oxidoreductase [Paenibacillus oenotherae]MBW7474453.1 SDR family oxidoreductase [Paenibacillus oenotherae]